MKKEDISGNVFEIDSNGNVSLKLSREKRKRRLGYVRDYPRKRIKRVWFKDEKEMHVFRKTDSWSIPHFMLDQVDGIVFTSEKYQYRIEVEQILNRMQYFHFKGAGYEKKVYVPREFWEKREVG